MFDIYIMSMKTVTDGCTLMDLLYVCPTRLFEYGAMRTAIEACAARTEPCVENTKLSTDNHAQSVNVYFRCRARQAQILDVFTSGTPTLCLQGH